MIDNWFLEKGSYQQGLALLYTNCGANKRIYSRLKNGKATPRNIAALKYELQKYRHHTTVIIPKVSKKKTPELKDTTAQKAVNSTRRSNQSVQLHMLTNTYLQERYIEKNTAYYKKWMLKKQLNALPSDAEVEALTMIQEIMKLTLFIDKIWREIDYFMEHKTLLPIANDYSKMSLVDQIKARQRLYQKRTKRLKTLTKLEGQASSIPVEKKALYTSKVEDKKNQLTQISLDIEKLNELIDG